MCVCVCVCVCVCERECVSLTVSVMSEYCEYGGAGEVRGVPERAGDREKTKDGGGQFVCTCMFIHGILSSLPSPPPSLPSLSSLLNTLLPSSAVHKAGEVGGGIVNNELHCLCVFFHFPSLSLSHSPPSLSLSRSPPCGITCTVTYEEMCFVLSQVVCFLTQ